MLCSALFLLLATTASETDGELPVRELLKLAHRVRSKHTAVAVTVVGAPSYASGAHMWNGTAATLKQQPMPDRTSPRRPSRH